MFSELKERLHFALFCILHRRSLKAQQTWQRKHLRRIVRHAYDRIPLWRTLLTEKNIDPDTVRTLADLSRLPITSKETYLGKMAEEYTDNGAPALSYWYVTSGTSGTPFTFLKSDHARQQKYVDFASLRFLWWRGESLSYISDIRYARIKIDAPSGAHRFFTPIKEYLENPHAALERIATFKPELLSTYPSILLDIAQLVEKDPALRFPTLRFVMSIGETLVPSVRASVEAALKCEVYDRYGLEEIGAIGVDCTKHNGFHINTESVIIEVVDESGQTLSDGKEGRIIVTNLFNYGMPFIRYDTGDHGVISYERCACGLASPRVWVKGRYSAYLSFPKRRIHHLEFDGALDKLMNYVFKYQIAKRSDTEIWARIIPGSAFHAGVPNMIEKSLRELVGADIRILVKEVSELPVTSRGKSRIVIDESGET